MKLRVNILSSLLISVFFVGCGGSHVISDISVFHKLPKIEKKETTSYSFDYYKGQENNLEYDSYKEKVKIHLAKHNFIENKNSNIVILLEYGIDNGKEKIGSQPTFGQTGVSSSRTMGTVNSYGGNTAYYSGTTTYTPTYGVTGSQSYSYSEYRRFLNLRMYKKDSKKIIYEAKAISSGSSSQLSRVIDEILKALFEDFPHNNGYAEVISVNSD